MRRREFISLLGGAAAWPLAARAQPATPLIGYVRSGSFGHDPYREPFLRGMRDLGWIDGRNVKFEFRHYGEDHRALTEVINELLESSKVVVLVTGGTPAVRAAQAATKTVPIVMVVNDPLGSGLIQSLARPGGNTTGLAALAVELTAKRLELLMEMLPAITKVAILKNPDNPTHPVILRETEPAARSLGILLRIYNARRPEDFSEAFAAAHDWQSNAMLVLDDSAYIAARGELAAQSVRHRQPLICGFREMAEAGALFSYAPSLADSWYRLATYVDKILKGAKPSDLPVEQGARFEFVVNLRYAKALGLQVPDKLLARADEVIE